MKKKKHKVNHEEYEIESDEYFYYIVGYTSNGAPFGVTWEEAIRDGLIEEAELVENVDDLPF